jgi:hypothetical protein
MVLNAERKERVQPLPVETWKKLNVKKPELVFMFPVARKLTSEC